MFYIMLLQVSSPLVQLITVNDGTSSSAAADKEAAAPSFMDYSFPNLWTVWTDRQTRLESENDQAHSQS